jgi:hypothetical protein
VRLIDNQNDTLRDRFVCVMWVKNGKYPEEIAIGDNPFSQEGIRNIRYSGNGGKNCCRVTRQEQGS